MPTHFSPLNSISIKHLNLKNRVAVAPMTRVSTNGDGIPTDEMAQYYRRYAEGGFALVITEGTYTDRLFAQAYPNQPGITTKQQQLGWQKVVEATQQAEGSIVLQLMHAGSLSQHLSNTRSASPIQPIRHMLQGYSKKQGAYPTPQAMNLSEIDDVIQGFVQAAKCAESLGFDGVEIHAANGYLLDQFLTDYTNDREDHYGGSVLNRCRLTTEIITAIQQAVSNRFIVGTRVSQGKVNDFNYLWPNGIEDGKVIFNALQQAGTDYIHFASEGAGFDHGCLTKQGQSLPKLAKDTTGLPIIANGGLHNPSEAKRILEDGHADLIALGTGALANPDWPKRLEANEPISPFDPRLFTYGVNIKSQYQFEESL